MKILNSEQKKKAIGFIHNVYLALLKSKRRHLASTKRKSEVSGGGRKPWRQKGTGQARAGSNRSPLWRGGGVSFGPQFHIVNKKVNKKERKIAIRAALDLNYNDTVIIKKNDFDFIFNSNSKTKLFFTFLRENKLFLNKRILFILPEISENLALSTKNLPFIELAKANSLGLAQILNSQKIILLEESINIINATYGDCY